MGKPRMIGMIKKPMNLKNTGKKPFNKKGNETKHGKNQSDVG